MKKKKSKGEVPEWIKKVRRARRQVDIDLKRPQEHSKRWETHKKDKFDKESNDVKEWDND